MLNQREGVQQKAKPEDLPVINNHFKSFRVKGRSVTALPLLYYFNYPQAAIKNF